MSGEQKQSKSSLNSAGQPDQQNSTTLKQSQKEMPTVDEDKQEEEEKEPKVKKTVKFQIDTIDEEG